MNQGRPINRKEGARTFLTPLHDTSLLLMIRLITGQLPVEQKDTDAMQVDERIAHAGLPVERGSKWIATKWIHPLPYPHGNPAEEADEPSSSSTLLSAV